MSEVVASKQPGQRRWTPGATVWFLWMVGMWVAFYILLFADKLEGLWSTIRDLPLLVEIVLWLPIFPLDARYGGLDEFLERVASGHACCLLHNRLVPRVPPRPQVA